MSNSKQHRADRDKKYNQQKNEANAGGLPAQPNS
jgi:hypothetical protein